METDGKLFGENAFIVCPYDGVQMHRVLRYTSALRKPGLSGFHPP